MFDNFGNTGMDCVTDVAFMSDSACLFYRERKSVARRNHAVLQKFSLLEVSNICFHFQAELFWSQHFVRTTRDATEACPGRRFQGSGKGLDLGWQNGLVIWAFRVMFYWAAIGC